MPRHAVHFYIAPPLEARETAAEQIRYGVPCHHLAVLKSRSGGRRQHEAYRKASVIHQVVSVLRTL